MPSLHHRDGSVSLELYNHDVTPSVLLVKREFTKAEWAALTAEAREAGTTVFELIRARTTKVEG